MAILLEANNKEVINKFKSLKKARDVADLLEVKYADLTYYLYRKPMESNYKKFIIKKRTGGHREIYTPISPIKILQWKLNDILQLIYKPKQCVHGYVFDKNVVTNAQTHVRKSYLLNIDLRDFFPSINFGRVRGMFMAKPYNVPDKAATILAQICCVNGQLPQGAPTSPVVSNMICGKLDSELQRLSRRFRCAYTRYADDISFSTNRKNFPISLARLIYDDESTEIEVGDLLRTVIEENGFMINTSKIRIQTKGTRQEVTNLVVNRAPNVKRNYIRQIRAMLHAINKFGLDNAEKEFHNKYYPKQINPDRKPPSMLKVLQGRINYIKMVKGESNLVYRKLYNKYCELVGMPKKYITNPLKDISPTLWILESEDPISQGSAFMLADVGLVTCQHVLKPGIKAFHHSNFNKKYSIQILFENKDIDLAILKLDIDKELASLIRGDPNDINQGDKVTLVGFPNYRWGDMPYITEGKVASIRIMTCQRRLILNTPIIAGNSGGPVINANGQVIGIAATGADRMENAHRTEDHGVIPITAIDHLLNKDFQPCNSR